METLSGPPRQILTILLYRIEFIIYILRYIEMNTTVFPIGLHEIFNTNVSSYLYKNHLNNLYGTCKDMMEQLDESGIYIYKQICLHYQPHSVDDLPAVISLEGDHYWYKEGELHRDGDLPAVIYSSGGQYWYKEGERHRDGDLPAIICPNGDQEWWKEGELHRDGDLPAIISSRDGQYWYKEGERHRDGDLPAIIRSDGRREWYKDGKLSAS
jgi:hypothetical protein